MPRTLYIDGEGNTGWAEQVSLQTLTFNIRFGLAVLCNGVETVLEATEIQARW